MPTKRDLSVKELKLDLKNFRTVPQRSETNALHAMISIAPERFWALTESLLDDGYLPTENIIAIKGGKEDQEVIVKEGNRRVGALKLIFGFISCSGLSVPEDIEVRIKSVPETWKSVNEAVPCTIYNSSEAILVDKIVMLAHGKGEKASRDNWTSVARARHNRDKNKASEPALDLLEKYIKDGKNLTQQQGELWGGDYPLTVLGEAINRIASRLELSASKELVESYPAKIKCRIALENILKDIGIEILGFKEIRNTLDDFQVKYGFPAPPRPVPVVPVITPTTPPLNPTGVITGTGPNVNVPGVVFPRKLLAISVNDPKHVIRELKKFSPRGNNRGKLVTLLEEARTLKLEKQPHCFCFLLRSMFEISAKAYCDDYASVGLSMKKTNGEDKSLEAILREITNHLTNNHSKNNPMTKVLHGAMTELATKDGVLSVTSMNQLVHNPKFVIDAAKIAPLFANIFPLLEAMNR